MRYRFSGIDTNIKQGYGGKGSYGGSGQQQFFQDLAQNFKDKLKAKDDLSDKKYQLKLILNKVTADNIDRQKKEFYEILIKETTLIE